MLFVSSQYYKDSQHSLGSKDVARRTDGPMFQHLGYHPS